MGRIYKLLKEFKYNPAKQQQRQRKNRDINKILYEKLKAKKKCAKCNKKGMVEIHHIVPVSHGGSNEEENLIALCKKCHLKADEELGVR
jgi:5-methylcytosine-specific restriction protein A